MSVLKESTISRYVMLSTDDFPAGSQIGSVAFQSDTKLFYKHIGSDVWSVFYSTATDDSTTIANFIMSDQDDYDIASATANTERWNVGYITGAEGGSADINTTTAGKLMVKVDPDVTPTSARYYVAHNLPLYADYFTVIIDCSVTFGAGESANPRATGIIISKGVAYDATNFIKIERQKTNAQNRIQTGYVLNGAAEVTAIYELTDTTVAFKIERWDNVWRMYYSLTQSPAYTWVLLDQAEDPNVYMTDQTTLFIESYSPGSLDTESVIGDFDNFRYYVGSGGGSQFIAGDYSSAWVTADADGNVFERQEYMQTQNASNRRIFTKMIAQVANLGLYTLATVGVQKCRIKSIVLRSVSASQIDMTSCAITGGDSNVITFLSAADTIVGNLDAIDDQVSWSGDVVLPVGGTIKANLIGTGATVTDLEASIEYMPLVDGGLLS